MGGRCEPAGELTTLDRWLVERTHAFVADATRGYERWLSPDVMREFEAYLDDLSNWYIRRSRRRFWADDEAALRTLWYALVQTLRVLAPILPFVTDHLWRTLVLDGPESVHLAGWPEVLRAGSRAARRDRRGAARRRARPAGALYLGHQAAAAAAPARRRGRDASTAISTRSPTSCA